MLGDYCQRPDPSPQAMTDVTAALVNQFAARSPAKVYLLHFAGSPDNPVRRQVSPKVEVIAAVRSELTPSSRTTSSVSTAIPARFWHYAISRKLLASIAWKP